MTTKESTEPIPPPAVSAKEAVITCRLVTATLVLIAALSFTFSFGNIWALGRRLGVPTWIAPLIGPAVDLSVVGLLVGIHYLTRHGMPPRQLRPARCLLIFSGIATLGLNIADPMAQGAYGRAAFDAVGPLLLIGWSEAGSGLLHMIHTVRTAAPESAAGSGPCDHDPGEPPRPARPSGSPTGRSGSTAPKTTPPLVAATTDCKDFGARPESGLLGRARRIDHDHRVRTGRPVSAETLRKELKVGAARARELVHLVRATS